MRKNYNIDKGLLHWIQLMDTADILSKIKKPKEKPVSDGLDFENSHHVRAFLKSLPKSLRKQFTPTTPDDLIILETRLAKFSIFEKERDQVMHVQKRFDLPLHPNMSLEKVAVYARIVLMNKKRKAEYEENNYKDPDKDEGASPGM